MFCSRCGKQINDSSKFCEFCGTPVGGTDNIIPAENTTKQRSGILELVVGSFLIIIILLNIFDGALDDGPEKVLYIICMLIASIVGITTRKIADNKGAITAGGIYLIGAIYQIVCGFEPISFFIALICSAVFFYCAFRRKKE